MEQERYQSAAPYPKIQVVGPNHAYARAMLSNVGGRDSEMSAVALYFYDHLVSREDEELAHLFHRISVVEMHHLEIFGQLTLLLGEDPRLWECHGNRKAYWSPGYQNYPCERRQLLEYALSSEEKAIAKYRRQIAAIDDGNIQALLARIIQDEEMHVTLFRELLENHK